jgi:serine-type D-Ala-D-Ala carboxypeptidase (penicillin-binding protein 5/6)
VRRGTAGVVCVIALAVALAGAGAEAALAAPGAEAALAAPGAGPAATPALGARAATLIEAGSGEQLYGRIPDSRQAIASATKLMTALVTLEHVHRLGVMFTQNGYVPAAEFSQIGLVPGERMSVHDLLIALMLPSADDAAEDLAFNIGHRSIARFVEMMNARARALGLIHTHYSTPIGLDTPGNYSSASDLVKLARYLLHASPFFKRIVSLKAAVLRTGNHVRAVANRNVLVAKVPWINGVKTGHTLDAGYVLVASGTKHGMTLISVVIGTPSESARDASTLSLLNYGFANYGLRAPVRKGAVLAQPTVRGRDELHAPVIAASTFKHVFRRTARVRLQVYAPRQLKGPLPRHSVVGSVAVVSGARVVGRVWLVAAQAIPAPASTTVGLGFITRPFTLVSLVVLLAVAIGLAVFWRGRTRGRRAKPA